MYFRAGSATGNAGPVVVLCCVGRARRPAVSSERASEREVYPLDLDLSGHRRTSRRARRSLSRPSPLPPPATGSDRRAEGCDRRRRRATDRRAVDSSLFTRASPSRGAARAARLEISRENGPKIGKRIRGGRERENESVQTSPASSMLAHRPGQGAITSPEGR